MAKEPKDEKDLTQAGEPDGTVGGSKPDTMTGGDGGDAAAEGQDSPWGARAGEERSDPTDGTATDRATEADSDRIESIEPEPVPRPEQESEATSNRGAAREPAGTAASEAEAKKGGWFKPVFYLILFLIVVGGPIGLLAWNPVIQPKVNEMSGLGLPKFYPFGPPEADPALAALADRVEALENAPAPEAAVSVPPDLTATLSTLRDDVDRLAGRLDAVDGRLSDLEAAPTPTPAASGVEPEDLAALRQRVDDGLAALRDQVSGVAQEMDGLRTEVRALEAIPTEAGGDSGVSAAQLAAVSARIDGLEQRLRAVPEDPAAALDRLRERIAGLDAGLADLADRPTATPEDVASAREAMESLMASLETMIVDLDSALNTRIDTVAADLEATRQASAEANRQDQAFVLAVSQFAGAIRNGRGFTAEVETLQALGAEIAPAVVARAEAGVPTLPELRLSFDPMARDVVRRALAGEEESVVGEALNRVADLVSIRRTGIVEGESADAIVARAETALEQDDVATALDALDALPEDLRAVARSWIEAARAKVEAEAEIGRLQSVATSRLGGAAAGESE